MTESRKEAGMPVRAGFCSLPAAVCLLATVALTAPAGGITVISQAANTDIYLGMPFGSLEFENPLAGNEMVRNYRMIEWRDADYAMGPWYDDWAVNNPSWIDGNPNEIWLRQANDQGTTSTTVASAVVSIHLNSDSNDGMAEVFVDGIQCAVLDMNTSPGYQTALIIVKGLTNVAHTVTVNDLGWGVGGDDVHIMGAAALVAATQDFGDAIDPPYPTYLASNGARHNPTGPILGAARDIEGNAFVNAAANGDDTNLPGAVDDEDGVVFLTPLVPGGPAQVRVVLSGVTTAYLSAWIDFNGDGSWATAGDKILSSQIITTGINTLTFTVPASATSGIQTYARFRVFGGTTTISYTGLLANGEVEDYVVSIEGGTLPLDFGDAPDPTYPTLLGSNGARHVVGSGLMLGNFVDVEANGQPTPNADGDDLNPPTALDDEDGVTFNTALFSNVPNTITVTTTNPAGMPAYLNGWIDLNGDGDWADAGEQIINGVQVFNGPNTVTFIPGNITAVGSTYARFRLSTQQNLPYYGPAYDGEVEDYTIDIAPVKWLQQPDLYETGVDVRLTPPVQLADDFKCTDSGPITDVHIWTSFRYDLGIEPLNSLPFTLFIYADVPAGEQQPYSHPGRLLWSKTFQPFTYNAGVCKSQIMEWWYDPMEEFWVFPGDWTCFQYDFYIPSSEAFRQVEGTIYWLSVRLESTTVEMGWKTSLDHWNDDACWLNPTTGTWQDLHYGDGHPLVPASMDLAFALTGYAEAPRYDFGDAPEGALAYPAMGVMGRFPTCQNVTAAGWIQHTNFGAYFGPMVDFETDGNGGICPSFSPYDNDECFVDGDAGLIMPLSFTIQGGLVVPCPASTGPGSLGITCAAAMWGTNIDINVTNFMPSQATGYVNVLADWDQNGAWAGASTCPLAAAPEHVLVNFPVPNGYSGPLSALGPPGFFIGPNAGFVWVRISITEVPVVAGWDGSGSFEDGETEDYLLQVDPPPARYDFGDAPDPTYPTLLASTGAQHVIVAGFMLGAQIDAEADGQQSANADGDDLAGVDDEDGVTFTSPLIPGVTASVDVVASAAGMLDAWVDFNGNGSWAEAGDQVFASVPLAAGTNYLSFTVPFTAVPTSAITTFARFRFSSAGGLPYIGLANDGEVEDYQVTIEPLKWLQGPDLDNTGVDVGNLRQPQQANDYSDQLADDFKCTQTGPITDIHIWTSYLDDTLCNSAAGGPDPNSVTFAVYIYSDIPATPADPTSYSHPGCLLWSKMFYPGQYNSHVYAKNLDEWWFDPTMPAWLQHADTMCWQYDFTIPMEEAFRQREGTVYWLAVQYKLSQECKLGWKTTLKHWNDDAVWLDMSSGSEVWKELRYGDEHPMQGESIDLAFAITGVPGEAPPTYDFGDAPDPSYPTLAASNGASHAVTGILLGAGIDPEIDGQPNVGATGDDTNLLYPGIPFPPGDEDGVAFLTPLVPGQPAIISVTAVGPAVGMYLSAWVDFNGDGNWTTAGDQIFVAQPIGPGVQNLTFAVPATATPSITTYARFRLHTNRSGVPFTGCVPYGEVEDYEAKIAEAQLDFGDAPDPTYPTLLASNGASHLIGSGLMLGNLIDAEPNGQPNATATGDDLAGLADEDGVTFNTALFPGVPNTITVTVTDPSSGVSYLSGWIDLNGDGDWGEAGEQVIVDQPMAPGVNSVTFVPGAITAVGRTFARFRLSYQTGLTDSGQALDGEVEDYLIKIAPVKWLQPPDLTPNGVDVDNGWVQLADDFQCTQSGPITDVHIWTSFANDFVPEILNSLTVTLFIYSDVPDPDPTNPEDWSHPGYLLWSKTFQPGSYDAGLCAYVPEGEWWHDPATQSWLFPGDHRVYQYDFYISEREAFRQREGTIYWIGMKYELVGTNVTMGWKTSYYHWNDDACWLDTSVTPAVWRELRYGDRHPLAPQSMDLAFALTGIEGPVPEPDDFGDAPDPTYPTLLASNGARHTAIPGFTLGNLIDTEANGQPNATATGDDIANVADEDGVTFNTAFFSGVPNTITVTANIPAGVTAYLNVWIDFNGDGDWADAGEQIFTDTVVISGVNNLTFTPPNITALGKTFARFRLSSVRGLSYIGAAPDGEVEDYKIDIHSAKWLQRPDLTPNGVDVDNHWVQLADDFKCTQTGAIKDIHIWTSFVGNRLPEVLNGLTITLYIYSDVPAGPDNLYSHPGELLWSKQFLPLTYSAGLCSNVIGEWWFDPATNYWQYPGDTQVYQYDFYLTDTEAFRQTRGRIYWLGMKYNPLGAENYTMGWKTTAEHWNDDACWYDTSVVPPIWRELRYGGEHPLAPRSIDLAFALTAKPCHNPQQDADGDGDVDLSDFSVFQNCFNGPNRPYASSSPLCTCMDADDDLDVDLTDFSAFQACFNGPNRPPSC